MSMNEGFNPRSGYTLTGVLMAAEANDPSPRSNTHIAALHVKPPSD
jgi:hypothetical protein